jgi:AcrR family transcriptional regulator
MPRRPQTTPRKKPRQERSQVTVGAILDACAHVLVTIGYDRASTNRIALAAGVSIGSLYQYYPSKEAIVAAVIERHVEHMSSLVRTKMLELAEAGASLRHAVPLIVHTMLEAHMLDPKLHKVLMEQVPRTGRLERIVGVEKEMEGLVLAQLEARRKGLRCKNVRVAAFLLVNTVEWITHAAVIQQRSDLETSELARELSDMIVRYLEE